MKKLLLLFFAFTVTISAQKKDITLEDIWSNNTFKTERLNAFHSMNIGDFYTILNVDRETKSTSLDRYDYKTLEKIETIIDSKNLENIDAFSDYQFDASETKLLLETKADKIYRRSSRGIYYVYDIASKKLQLVSEHKIQEPSFSPDGTQVAFMFDNNIYITDLINNGTLQITTDGEKNKIINGITDWVYEEEFGFVRAFEWNKNSNKLAYLRFNETEVPEFSMDMYGTDLYPKQHVFKYPKAGEKNAFVSLHIFNTENKKSNQVNLGDKAQYYIPRIQWTNNSNALAVTTLNRHQNNLNLLFIDGSWYSTKRMLRMSMLMII